MNFVTRNSRKPADVAKPKVLNTPGRWRCVADPHDWRPLPSCAGVLTVVRVRTGRWLYIFETATSTHEGWAESAEIGADGRVHLTFDEYECEYAPAGSIRKARRLPVPPRPTLTRYLRVGWGEAGRIHKVTTVEEWPDPNREWNGDDALVIAVCGETGWVEPKNMEPALAHALLCGACWS